jgi:predicted alpha/beta hydrolase
MARLSFGAGMDMEIVSADGVGHTATVFPSERLDAPVVVCLPAMGAAADYYRPFAEALAAQGLANSVLLDLRGQGRSTARARNGDQFGYLEILELDLPKAISLLRRVFRGRKLYLAGHSLGGQLGLFCAGRPGVEVDGLILIAAGTAHWGAWRGVGRAWVRLVANGIRLAARLLPWYPGSRLGFGGDQPRRMMRDWGRVAAQDRYAPEGSDFDYERAARALALPVLSIGVRGDPIAPAGAREALLARIPASRVTRIEVDGVRAHGGWKRHFSWARRPADVVSALGGWLRAQPA